CPPGDSSVVIVLGSCLLQGNSPWLSWCPEQLRDCPEVVHQETASGCREVITETA
ncbi:hypothetical protein RRG08_066891, partial [Elysia crispata]